MGVTLVAALWGFAEATLFFIVPDVAVSWIAIRQGWRAGIVAAFAAAVGAVLGGLVMYRWGTPVVLDAVPGIGPELIAEVEADSGLAAMVRGAFTGVPYKLYATLTEAGPLPFVAVSLAARSARFAWTATIAAGLARLVPRRWQLPIWLGFWLLLYAVYFGWVTR